MKLSYVPDSSPGPVTVKAASGNVVFEPRDWARVAASLHFWNPTDSGPRSE